MTIHNFLSRPTPLNRFSSRLIPYVHTQARVQICAKSRVSTHPWWSLTHSPPPSRSEGSGACYSTSPSPSHQIPRHARKKGVDDHAQRPEAHLLQLLFVGL